MKKITFLLVLFVAQALLAQNDFSGPQPLSWKLTTAYDASIEKFKNVPFEELAKEDAKNDLDKSIPWRFGYDFSVNIDPDTHGQKITLDNGDQLWRVRIQSPGAKTINIFFDWFDLRPGAWMRVASHDQSDLSKLFTYEQNNVNKALGIWPVASDDVWVEFYEPKNSIGQSRLEIGNVVHGYRTAIDFNEAKALNDSGDCNQDVDCDITPPGADPFSINQVKEDVKKSVAMLVSGNTGFCTGSLINNTANDGAPLFITANHCGNSVAGWAFRFNWRSPTPSCATTTASPNGTFNQTASGATLLMNNSGSDMQLVRITDTGFFNANPDVVWNGWNKSGTTIPSMQFGIHHPSGDIQKTCRDDQSAAKQTTSFNGDPTTEVWRISDWDLGVTEPGSSGSPLFNQDGQLIGVLSGGAAACNGTNDNNAFDIYGRFDTGFSEGTTAATRLSDWLDPNNTGQVTLGQYPPLQVFAIDASVALNNVPSEVCSGAINPVVQITNRGSSTLTSVDVVYTYDRGATNTTINYTGSIAQGAIDTVSLPAYTVTAATTLSVRLVNPNGVADQNGINNLISADFDLNVSPSFAANNTVSFNITTDNFANETSWQVTDSSGAIIASGAAGSLANATTYNLPFNIVTGECYEFTISDSYADGICCGFGQGSYTLTTDTGIQIFTGGNFGAAEVTPFKIDSTAGLEDVLQNSISVFPNPSSGIFNVESTLDAVKYDIYDLSGKLITSGNLTNGRSEISLDAVANGLYLMNLSINEVQITKKLIKS
ncbi:T9SS type A sorting domain-containing protein [Nonlabens sp. Ci31]|uniref:T9SS type A sorting domain-containing protein n=1 Tax=Nonlabens sp. Ci31 TaxID=2608253 RepID=UPI0014648B6F|nr:T9SS type A sorting domain-containing protein [Nonlabens sp. Ci31]QJP33415.1 T9SS type A sorting domain-containing protein [Nonlabens sp. Ci31]